MTIADPEVCAVIALDKDFARVVEAYGEPPQRHRRPGFESLLKIIVQQQVSLASGTAIWRRMKRGLPRLSAARVAQAGEAELRALGLSRQKARYARALADAVASRDLNLARLHRLGDEAVAAELTRIKGIGPWTAEIYLLSALRRPDVWPAGDLALAVAAQVLKDLPARPGIEQMREQADAWRPHRAAAARLLWHYYRGVQGREVAP